MIGAVERSGNVGPAKDLAHGAGENAPLSQKENFGSVPHPAQVRSELKAFARRHPAPGVKTLAGMLYANITRIEEDPADADLRRDTMARVIEFGAAVVEASLRGKP